MVRLPRRIPRRDLEIYLTRRVGPVARSYPWATVVGIGWRGVTVKRRGNYLVVEPTIVSFRAVLLCALWVGLLWYYLVHARSARAFADSVEDQISRDLGA